MRWAIAVLLVCSCGSSEDAPDGPLGLAFEAIEVEGGLTMATELRFLPGGGGHEMLVASKDGRVGHLRLDGDRAERLGEFRVPGVFSASDCGIVSLALDPDFAASGYIYVGACASATESMIVRLAFDPAAYDAIGDTAVEIMRAGDPLAERPWHNVGALGFDATGAMWALFGDKLVDENGQDLDDDLGAVVRIVPSRDPDEGGHAPAPDNPFVDAADRDPDVYAYGLRSPWRGVLDASGRLWIGDVGANGVEEINILAAPGDNFGWPVHEGPCAGDCDGLRDPATWWPHDDPITPYLLDDPEAVQTTGRVGWVGLEQRPLDERDPYGGRLAGRMLFGDFCLGFVRALAIDEGHAVVSDEHLGHLPHATSWDQGPDGFAYAATFGSCDTVRLDESQPPPSGLWRAVAVERPETAPP